MEETITLINYSPNLELPEDRQILIKTEKGNYYVGKFEGNLFKILEGIYLSERENIITHYAILK